MKNNNTCKKYKIVFTDYYFTDINKEIRILNKLGNVEIIDSVFILHDRVKKLTKKVMKLANRVPHSIKKEKTI